MSNKTITVYYKNRNRQSKETLDLLIKKKCELQKKEISKKSLKRRELLSLLNKLDMCPEEIIKKDAALYIRQFKNKDLSNPEWVEVLCENPQLIDQPIIVKGDHAVIPETIEDVMKIIEE